MNKQLNNFIKKETPKENNTLTSLTLKQINNIIPKIGQKNLDTYIWLQKNLYKCDVSKNRKYQRTFNGYYRIRRDKKWQKFFYDLFEFKKNKHPDFGLILLILWTRVRPRRFEVSFSSKMMATINPNLPIIDSVVLKNLCFNSVTGQTYNKWNEVDRLYKKIQKNYCKFLVSKKGKYLIKQFKKHYPDKKISEVKMLDFVLWTIRD